MMEIFRAFSEFGIDTVSIRRFSQEKASGRPRLLAQIVTTKVVAAAVCYAVSLLVMIALAGDSLTLVFSVIANLSLFSANLVGAFSSYYQSQLKMSEVLPRNAGVVRPVPSFVVGAHLHPCLVGGGD